MDIFLQYYFLYVHPCLPILDQAQFLFDYRHPEQSTCQYSLPLLQAVLCAAAAVSDQGFILDFDAKTLTMF